MLNVFWHVYLPSVYLQNFCPFFKSGFFFLIVLKVPCIFWTILYQMSFASIFSQSVAYLILLTVSSTEQMFLILIKSSLSIIHFMGNAFGGVPKIHHHTQGHLDFLLCSLLGVLLECCILHLGLWYIFSQFWERHKISI